MKTLLINLPGYQREECCSGKVMYNTLPSQIFLAARYLLDKGLDVTVVDAQTQPIPNLNDFDVAVVWVAILEGLHQDVDFIKRCKDAGLKTVMILNDPMGVEKEVVEKFEFIDYCVRLHEREIVLGDLLATLEKGIRPSFPGLIYRTGRDVVDTGETPFRKDLQHLRSCASLLSKLSLEKYSFFHLTTGRGCPMVCTFCQYCGTGARKRKIEDIMEEFDLLSKYDGDVYFNDLNMPADLRWTEAFLNELIRRRNTKHWKTDLRADQCTDSLLSLLKQAGCNAILMGIETLDDEILTNIGKHVSHETLVAAIRRCREYGLTVDTTFMIGFPWDSNETIQKTYDFIKTEHIITFGLAVVMPIRGKKIYDDFVRLGLLTREISFGDYVNARVNRPICRTLYLSENEIVKWYKKISSLRLSPRFAFDYVRKFGFKPRYFKTFYLLFSNWLKSGVNR